MNFLSLKEKFKTEKQYEATSVHELLNYVKKLYLSNEVTISEYRQLVKLLETEGARNPEEAV
ncbi:YppF family protein [Bacillus alveayuensis]|jgi:hypothetical protein|uniref:YppF-like protein n=1 Tax=Aeribacillus alveayuensis TaxID=279215 RepID=A0ABT9VKV9_9BACI|nr:YppF family protein [Bacillus alveayuensis]MDQ0161581.1 hypothetical protein [Bacillus alveayuensis]